MNTTITRRSVSWILRNATDSVDIAATDEDGNLDWFAILAGKVSHAHFDKLADDIMAYGFTLPIVLVENRYSSGYKIGNGHHRLSAAIMLGLDSIPVIIDRGGDYMRLEDSHDGEWDCGDRSYEYWELLRQNFPVGYSGDTDNDDHRAQFAGYENSYSEYAAKECGRCGEYMGCESCHFCTNPKCSDCEYDEAECICEVVTPRGLGLDEYGYIFCQDCNGYGYRVNHAACGLEGAHTEALRQASVRRAAGLDVPPGQWHPAYILDDAYGEQEEWLRDEPIRLARRAWSDACEKMRGYVAAGVSDISINILAGDIRAKWDAYQAL